MKTGIVSWKGIANFLWRFFSISELFKTLFVPWHQERATSSEGFSFFERMIFGLFTRVLGAVIRLVLISLGFLVLIIHILLFPVFFLIPISVDLKKLNHHRALGRDLAFRFTPKLKQYARDMSNAPETALIGKAETLARLQQVLARESQNNAIVVGRPGVGRTTLLEQLAKKISWGETLEPLKYRHVFELDLDGLSGNNLRDFLNEATSAGNIILVIDNIHAYPDALDIILPFIKASSIQIIGVTDIQGYHSVLKTREDLLQGFEKIELDEASDEEVALLIKLILDGRGIKYEDQVPEEVVKLTGGLIYDSPQPEKSLDIVEELLVANSEIITVQDVRHLITQKTGVPAEGISENERDILLGLEEKLRREIIGQEQAIEAISGALRRSRSGLGDKKRPIGSFLFLGSTGVGKTHTAKILSSIYYGEDKPILRFDMSEFSQANTTDEFVKQLVIGVEENPFTLILFDEIEKANRAVLNLFLQILDEAHITDQTGRQAHFNNAFIICTSNAGSEFLLDNPAISQKEFLTKLISVNALSPEFINRFDEAVLFTPLSKDQSKKIVELMLAEFVERIKDDRQITVTYNEDLVDVLAGIAYSSTFGARSIRRTLQDTVENYLAEQIIKNNLKSGGSIFVPTEIVSSGSST